MSAKYLVRLDDACPTFQFEKWKRFFDLFDKYNVKPIIALIPANDDPKLKKGNMPEDEFWDMARQWEAKEWCVAIHGYNHVYTNTNAGIISMTPHSEFAAVPEDIQREKLTLAKQIFNAQGLKGEMFVAPSHSFDETTLRMLVGLGITTASDGHYPHTYEAYGMRWIPCQLSYPKEKKSGVWTLCYHPETATDAAVAQLESFIASHQSNFISADFTLATPITLTDRLSASLSKLRYNPLIKRLLTLIRR